MSTGSLHPRPHFYVLLDRSGSMESMRADVIGGFNNLLAEQQADGADARLTLVQFDSQDPQELLADAVRIDRVRPARRAHLRAPRRHPAARCHRPDHRPGHGAGAEAPGARQAPGGRHRHHHHRRRGEPEPRVHPGEASSSW